MQRWVVFCWALLALVAAEECPDGGRCGEGQTCCNDPADGYGCCPLEQAVCCEDKLHCCPHGWTCDVQNSKCISSFYKKETRMWAKLPARARAGWKIMKEAEEVTAEGATGSASEKSPEVTRALPVPPSEEETSVSSVTKGGGGNVVQCNDTVACVDGTTCCRGKDNEWACCPLPEAVCCEDFIHCCPKGQKCNLITQTCDDNARSVPLVQKTPAIPRQRPTAGDIPCDSTTACPDDNTCCKNKEGSWDCCPLPEAVCCQDHEHCCPKGKQCNLAVMSCDDVAGSVPWLEKVPALPRQRPTVGDVPCDSTTACPDNTTCCKAKDGSWECCPLPLAVCCEDHEHCCPNGTTCNLTTLTCDDTAGSTPMKQKIPSTSSRVPSSVQTEETREVKGRTRCDPQTSCPQHMTCCFMAQSQKWGCCPLTEAVCCADGDHCCPAHFKCDQRGTNCVKGDLVIPWYTKLPATTTSSSVQADSRSVQCDALNLCPEHTTCCQLFTGGWGCCPLQNAVCCSNMTHCCPSSYTCDKGGVCRHSTRPNWHMFLSDRKRALIL